MFFGSGLGEFGGASSSFGGGIQPIAVAVADLNRDSKPDLVVANSGSNDITVLIQQNGAVVTFISFTYSVGTYPRGIAIADLNGDSNPDIIITNYNSSTLSILLGNGTGGFSPATRP